MTMGKTPVRRVGVDNAPEALSIEDTGVTLARLRRLPDGSASQCNPYGGVLIPKPRTRKKDLRKLGEWIKAKHKVEDITRQEAALTRPLGTGRTKKS